jgi:uncharacterized protein (DUF433 family)
MNASTPAVEIGTLIACSPGIKNGSPHISGTGILVRTIARFERTGLSPEEIAARFGPLRLEQVHAALAFYYADRQEIDSDLKNSTAKPTDLKRKPSYIEPKILPGR